MHAAEVAAATSGRHRRGTGPAPNGPWRARFREKIRDRTVISSDFEAGGTSGGRSPPPPFRTIQVCPKDLPAALRQAALAEMRPQRVRGHFWEGANHVFDMRRREFIVALGGATAWSLVSSAQQGRKVYRIGILETIPAAQNAANLDALRKGLQKLGYVEGQNLVIQYRSAEGHAERFPDMASELIRLKVDLIVTRGTPAVQAAKNAAGEIPVVMAAMGAPFLVVASLSHPGGNVTGMTTFSAELIGKRIELLKELVPSLSRLALIHNIGNPKWVRLNGKRLRRQRPLSLSEPSCLTSVTRETCVAHSK